MKFSRILKCFKDFDWLGMSVAVTVHLISFLSLKSSVYLMKKNTRILNMDCEIEYIIV